MFSFKIFIGYYHGASSIVHGGNYVDDFGYYKAHHGFSIVNGGFSYNGVGKFRCFIRFLYIIKSQNKSWLFEK